MKDYEIHVFWSGEDKSYVGDIPDLFPCSGFGETPEQALAEVLAAKEAWLEAARENGLRVPVPTRRLESKPVSCENRASLLTNLLSKPILRLRF